jgi:adenylate cyclase
MDSILAVVDWLVDGARSATLAEDVLAELCRRMVACDLPLWRVAVFVRSLHPDIAGRRFVWYPESGVSTSEASFSLFESDEFQASPVAAIYDLREPFRRHLSDSDCRDNFLFLRDLRAQGVTDYVGFPLHFTDGTIQVSTWTTQQPGGFTTEQFTRIQSIITPLARVAEVRALRRTATNLLNTYVGRQAGERILAGKIQRGHIEEIYAAIWLSDMRGFTTLSEQLPSEDLIDLLNRYFECQVPVILKHGGEVLKFMGDGLLAIFPLSGDANDTEEVCRRALMGAREVQVLVNDLEVSPRAARKEAVRFGLALHVGQVKYGNIGGGDRLDFTCIGPAVNLAARLEKVAGKLGRPIVASAEFVAHFPDQFVSLGEFSVAGFAAHQLVFGLRDQVGVKNENVASR